MSFLCKNHPIVETEITADHNDPQASVGRFLGSLEEVAWKKSLIRGNRQGEAGPAGERVKDELDAQPRASSTSQAGGEAQAR